MNRALLLSLEYYLSFNKLYDLMTEPARIQFIYLLFVHKHIIGYKQASPFDYRSGRPQEVRLHSAYR